MILIYIPTGRPDRERGFLGLGRVRGSLKGNKEAEVSWAPREQSWDGIKVLELSLVLNLTT
jgi:hypothetical protein